MAYRVVWSPRALDDVDSIASLHLSRFDRLRLCGRRKNHSGHKNAQTIPFQVESSRNLRLKAFGNVSSIAIESFIKLRPKL